MKLKEYIAEQTKSDPEFKAEYELEALRLQLIRARQKAGLTQEQVAKLLGVSQPRIAQIERGTKPASLRFFVRYANAVNSSVRLVKATAR